MMQPCMKLVEQVMITPNHLTQQLSAEIFTIASVAAGCRHCQAQGA